MSQDRLLAGLRYVMLATYSRGMPRAHREIDDTVRITTAATSRNDDIRKRQRRYLASMSLRTVCFVGAVIVGEGVLMWILIAGRSSCPTWRW